MADPAFGVRSTVVADLEASWGTAKGTPNGKQISVTQSTLIGTQQLIRNTSITGTLNQLAPVLGQKSASGNVDVVANLISLPFWMKLFCGNIATTGAGDPYTHISKITNSGPSSAVIETSFNIGGTLRYSTASGVRINQLTIPIDPVGFLSMNMAMEAKDVIIGSAAYDASLVDWWTGAPNNHLQLLTANVLLGGSPVGYINKGSLNFNAKLNTDDYRVGSLGARGSLVPGVCEVGGSLTLCLDNTTVITAITSSASTSLSFTWTETASSRTFTIALPVVYIEKTGPTLANDGPVMINANFIAAYDTSSSTSVTFTTINGDAGTNYA